MKRILVLTALLIAPTMLPALTERTPAPEGAAVYFLTPDDGATVANPVTIRFGLTGMGVAPAGVEWDNTGHHHLLVNLDPAGLDLNEFLPATDEIIHFGGGQTEAVVDLPPGTHTLWLLLGDHMHVPHDPPIVSAPLTITVE